jgi:hypothetical protein
MIRAMAAALTMVETAALGGVGAETRSQEGVTVAEMRSGRSETETRGARGTGMSHALAAGMFCGGGRLVAAAGVAAGVLPSTSPPRFLHGPR